MSDHRIGFNLARQWAKQVGASFTVEYYGGAWRGFFIREGETLGSTLVDHWDRNSGGACGDCLSLFAVRRILFNEATAEGGTQ